MGLMVSRRRGKGKGKGKARTRIEFRCKVSLATANRPASVGQFVIGARAPPEDPFDGHTLAAPIARTERITGVPSRGLMPTPDTEMARFLATAFRLR